MAHFCTDSDGVHREYSLERIRKATSSKLFFGESQPGQHSEPFSFEVEVGVAEGYSSVIFDPANLA